MNNYSVKLSNWYNLQKRSLRIIAKNNKRPPSESKGKVASEVFRALNKCNKMIRKLEKEGHYCLFSEQEV